MGHVIRVIHTKLLCEEGFHGSLNGSSLHSRSQKWTTKQCRGHSICREGNWTGLTPIHGLDQINPMPFSEDMLYGEDGSQSMFVCFHSKAIYNSVYVQTQIESAAKMCERINTNKFMVNIRSRYNINSLKLF